MQISDTFSLVSWEKIINNFFYFLFPARSQFLSISVAVSQVSVQLTLLRADTFSQCIKVARYEASNFFTTMGTGFLILAVTVVILKEEDDKKKKIGMKEMDSRKRRKY